jgi:hypothetical protein
MSMASLRRGLARIPAWVVDAGWAVAVAVAVTIAIQLAREPGASPRPARLRAGVDDRCPATGPAARLAERIPPECWLRISAGWDAKGRRWYAWSRVALATACASDGWGRWLLARRSLTTGELAHYVCAGPASTPLVALVRVAGTRWRVEEAFQAGKGLCGLDEHQVRRWRSWYRWVTLAMLAYAFLVVAAVTEHARHPPPLGLLPLTCNEIQHLFAALACQPAGDRAHWLRWSWWRRRHQARARACHYRRQANGP